MKRLCFFTAVLAALMLFCACGGADVTVTVTPDEPEQAAVIPTEAVTVEPVQTAAPSSGEASSTEFKKGGRGGMFSGPSNDEAALAVLAECAPKFEQRSFTDPDTGFVLEYSLYIPEVWDGTEKLPLIQFMPDSTGTGRSAQNLVENYYGAAVWASERDQAKHPCFVLVPAYTEAIADDNWGTSPQLETGVKLLHALTEEFNLDTDRFYTTGQSGGCMASLHFADVYPDLFAASLFVSGQWDIAVLDKLKDYPFFYITAGGDQKASGGQTEVLAMLDAAAVPYSYGTWSAQDGPNAQNDAAQALVDEGLKANFVRFETGTVAGEGAATVNEHMASFNYAYKLEPVRDWLFEQVRE